MYINVVFGILGTFVFGLFLILNGLRYYKYGRLVVFTPEIYSEDMYGGFAALSIIFGGVCFLPFILFFFLFSLHEIILDLFLILLAIAIFYWYWHTKKDPFAFDKVWEDPSDKKKKEPK